jgi:phosphoglycerate dehydrogenase-like enzyme
MMQPALREIVFITSPLETEHAARIQSAAGDRAKLIYDPDLFPPTRYQSDHKGVDGFTRTPEQETRWRAHLARATILWDFPSGPPAKGGGLALAPHVHWVQTTSSGVGGMVHSLGLADSDLIVTTARGVHADALAEFVMMCVLAHAKDLPRMISGQRAHRWERYCCHDLVGATLLVVGAGQVGAQVGKVARAFGLRVLALVNRKDPARAAELSADAVYGPADLHHALGRADYVVLAMPHTPQTERMIDARALAAMKPGVALINIARGQVVDEEAMIANLRSGHIAFAGLDVAMVEPLPDSSPLWDLPNVLISPHSASTAPSENGKIVEIFCRNLDAFLAGRPYDMTNVLDKQRRY